MAQDNTRLPAVLFMAMGSFIVAISLGWIDLPEQTSIRRSRGLFDHPRHWQVTSFGLCFFTAGVSLYFQQHRNFLLTLLRTTCALTLIVPMCWLLYFSGKAPALMQWAFGFILLMTGSLAAFFVWYEKRYPGRIRDLDAPDEPEDPVVQARPLLHYGHHEKARELLQGAIHKHPAGAPEFRRMLDSLPRKP